MKIRSQKLFWLALACLALLFAAGVFFRGGDSAPARRYKAQLRARGEKLSFAELGFPRPPADNLSGVILLTNAALQIRASKFPASQVGNHSSAAPGKMHVLWRGAGLAMGTDTNLTSWDEVDTACGNLSNELVAVWSASENPCRYFVCDPLAFITNYANVPRFPFVEMRETAQFLNADGIAALHRGDLGHVRSNWQALVRLTEFNREDPTLVAAMIRVALSGLGEQFSWQALQHPGWRESDLAAVQQDWERVDLFEAVELGLTCERAFTGMAFDLARQRGLSTVMRIASVPPAQVSPWERTRDAALTLVWNADEDEMHALEFHQSGIESIRALRTNTPWRLVRPIHQARYASHEKTLASASGLNRFRYLLSALVVPNFSRAVETTVRNETQRRMTIAALALKRFELTHHAVPEKLDELVPAFLKSVPIDPVTGEPLKYRREPGGGFTLYSVGDNGTDDGGDPSSTAKILQSDWWSGRDVVWPAPGD